MYAHRIICDAKGYIAAEYFDKESLINSLPVIRFNSDTIPNWFAEMYFKPCRKGNQNYRSV
jgi:hypothetical protein